MGQAEAAEEIPSIGIGMLGYAFMGKAHSNALKKIAYMTWPPPYIPRLVAISGRTEDAVQEAARRYGYEKWSTSWRGRRRRPGRPDLRQRRAERHARRADDRGREGRQARDLREAARPHRRRELRDLEGGRGDGRQAHDRVQLPLLPGDPARQGDDRRGRARRDLPLPRPLPPGVDHGSASSRRSGGSTRRSPAPAPSATSART